MKKLNKNGFTFIELIIVLSISLLVFSIAGTKVALHNHELKSQANEIVSALRYTWQLNNSGELGQKFVLRKENGEIYFLVSDLSAGGKTHIKKKIDSKIIIQKRTSGYAESDDKDSKPKPSEYTSLNTAGNVMFFEARFTSDAAVGAGTITLDSENSTKLYKITIVPTSGRIYVYEINKN